MSLFVCTSNQGKLAEFASLLSLPQNEIISLKDVSFEAQKSFESPLENSNFFLSNALIKLIAGIKLLFDSKEKNQLFFNKVSHILVDDSGLCVPNLKYMPGVHSSTYAGVPRNDVNNKLKLMQEIENSNEAEDFLSTGRSKPEKRLNAFFVCFLLSINLTNNIDLKLINELNIQEGIQLDSNIISKLEELLLAKIDLNLSGDAQSVSIPLSALFLNTSDESFIDIAYGYCTGFVSNFDQNLIIGAGHGYDSIFYGKEQPELSFASITIAEKNLLSHRAHALRIFKKKLFI